MTKTEILKRIRAKCLDCCCDSPKEVKLCPVEKCALWPLRFGIDPTRRQLSEQERQARLQGLRRHLAQNSTLDKTNFSPISPGEGISRGDE